MDAILRDSHDPELLSHHRGKKHGRLPETNHGDVDGLPDIPKHGIVEARDEGAVEPVTLGLNYGVQDLAISQMVEMAVHLALQTRESPPGETEHQFRVRLLDRAEALAPKLHGDCLEEPAVLTVLFARRDIRNQDPHVMNLRTTASHTLPV